MPSHPGRGELGTASPAADHARPLRAATRDTQLAQAPVPTAILAAPRATSSAIPAADSHPIFVGRPAAPAPGLFHPPTTLGSILALREMPPHLSARKLGAAAPTARHARTDGVPASVLLRIAHSFSVAVAVVPVGVGLSAIPVSRNARRRLALLFPAPPSHEMHRGAEGARELGGASCVVVLGSACISPREEAEKAGKAKFNAWMQAEAARHRIRPGRQLPLGRGSPRDQIRRAAGSTRSPPVPDH